MRQVASQAVALAFMLFFLPSILWAQTNQISGSFRLPSGVNATGTGAVFEISTDPLDQFTLNSRVAFSSTAVTVLPGNNSANYSLRLDNSPNQVSKKIKFECVSGCQSLDITSVGWWSASRGVVGRADASDYLANANLSIDLTMEGADTFAGTIVLPEGFTSTGNEEYTVEVRESSFAVTALFTQTVAPAANATSVPFRIGVPAQETGGGWNLNIRCQACEADLEDGPYYPRSASGNPVSLAAAGQFFFLKNNDFTNMQFDLISLRKPEVSPAAVVGAISLLLLAD